MLRFEQQSVITQFGKHSRLPNHSQSLQNSKLKQCWAWTKLAIFEHIIYYSGFNFQNDTKLEAAMFSQNFFHIGDFLYFPHLVYRSPFHDADWLARLPQMKQETFSLIVFLPTKANYVKIQISDHSRWLQISTQNKAKPKTQSQHKILRNANVGEKKARSQLVFNCTFVFHPFGKTGWDVLESVKKKVKNTQYDSRDWILTITLLKRHPAVETAHAAPMLRTQTKALLAQRNFERRTNSLDANHPASVAFLGKYVYRSITSSFL